MDGDTLWAAVALVLVIEGLLPFLSPVRWRKTFERILQMTDGQIRFFGLGSTALGLLLLWLVL